MSKKLSREEIEKHLEEINEYLKAENKHGDILIAGGAALTMVFGARDATYDIDCVFRPAEDLRRIVRIIAEDNDLNEGWLNDGVKGFINEKMTSSVVRRYSNLVVSSLDAKSLLAMKLASAREGTMDMQDSIFLMKAIGIKEERELFEIIEQYIEPTRQTIQMKYFTMEAFGEYSRQMGMGIMADEESEL